MNLRASETGVRVEQPEGSSLRWPSRAWKGSAMLQTREPPTDYRGDSLTQEDCIVHLEQARWGGEPTCPYCSSTKTARNQYRHRCYN